MANFETKSSDGAGSRTLKRQRKTGQYNKYQCDFEYKNKNQHTNYLHFLMLRDFAVNFEELPARANSRKALEILGQLLCGAQKEEVDLNAALKEYIECSQKLNNRLQSYTSYKKHTASIPESYKILQIGLGFCKFNYQNSTNVSLKAIATETVDGSIKEEMAPLLRRLDIKFDNYLSCKQPHLSCGGDILGELFSSAAGENASSKSLATDPRYSYLLSNKSLDKNQKNIFFVDEENSLNTPKIDENLQVISAELESQIDNSTYSLGQEELVSNRSAQDHLSIGLDGFQNSVGVRLNAYRWSENKQNNIEKITESLKEAQNKILNYKKSMTQTPLYNILSSVQLSLIENIKKLYLASLVEYEKTLAKCLEEAKTIATGISNSAQATHNLLFEFVEDLLRVNEFINFFLVSFHKKLAENAHNINHSLTRFGNNKSLGAVFDDDFAYAGATGLPSDRAHIKAGGFHNLTSSRLRISHLEVDDCSARHHLESVVDAAHSTSPWCGPSPGYHKHFDDISFNNQLRNFYRELSVFGESLLCRYSDLSIDFKEFGRHCAAGTVSYIRNSCHYILSLFDNKTLTRIAAVAMFAYANIENHNIDSSYYRDSINYLSSHFKQYYSSISRASNFDFTKDFQLNLASFDKQTSIVSPISKSTQHIANNGLVVSAGGAESSRLSAEANKNSNVAIIKSTENKREHELKISSLNLDKSGKNYDFHKGFETLNKLANDGYVPAQFKLGKIYEDGSIVTQDLGAAINWYIKAAEGGDVYAMHNLGVIYSRSKGKKVKFRESLSWFIEAGKRGLSDSQYNLGVIYAKGIGVKADKVEAYAWLDLAAAQGDEEAKKIRDDIGANLLLEEIDRAHDRSQQLVVTTGGR